MGELTFLVADARALARFRAIGWTLGLLTDWTGLLTIGTGVALGW